MSQQTSQKSKNSTSSHRHTEKYSSKKSKEDMLKNLNPTESVMTEIEKGMFKTPDIEMVESESSEEVEQIEENKVSNRKESQSNYRHS